jgi:hypothetical protein
MPGAKEVADNELVMSILSGCRGVTARAVAQSPPAACRTTTTSVTRMASFILQPAPGQIAPRLIDRFNRASKARHEDVGCRTHDPRRASERTHSSVAPMKRAHERDRGEQRAAARARRLSCPTDCTTGCGAEQSRSRRNRSGEPAAIAGRAGRASRFSY